MEYFIQILSRFPSSYPHEKPPCLLLQSHISCFSHSLQYITVHLTCSFHSSSNSSPICSMYGIFTNIYPKHGPNVGKYYSTMEHMGHRTFSGFPRWFPMKSPGSQVNTSQSSLPKFPPLRPLGAAPDAAGRIAWQLDLRQRGQWGGQSSIMVNIG